MNERIAFSWREKKLTQTFFFDKIFFFGKIFMIKKNFI